MLVIPVTTFGLGTWQVFRLQWKLGLIDELERKTKENPVAIPTEYGHSKSSFLPPPLPNARGNSQQRQ